MLIDQEANLSTSVLSAKLRWLAVLAGCSSAVFGLMAFGSPFLILGAVIQPRARTSGRWLMWLGSLLLSLVVVPFGTAIVFENARHLGRDNWSVGIFPLFVLSTILVCWLDVAIVMEGLRSKRNPWVVPGSLDWLAWLAAMVLSAWSVWAELETVRAYRRLGSLRLDLILTPLGLDALVLWFDVALIIHAVKSRRKA